METALICPFKIDGAQKIYNVWISRNNYFGLGALSQKKSHASISEAAASKQPVVANSKIINFLYTINFKGTNNAVLILDKSKYFTPH